MSRLERKCIIGSAAFHGLLLVIFLFGSAFLSSKPEKPMPVITIIDYNGKLTDQPLTGGGSPQGNPTPPPPAPANPTPPPPPPPVEPPKVEPVKPQPVKPAEPEVVKPPKVTKPKEPDVKKPVVDDNTKERGDFAASKNKKPTPDKPKDVAENTKPARKININTNVSTRSNTEVIAAQIAAQKRAADEKAAREYAGKYAAYQRELQARNSQIGSVIDGVGKNIGNKTVTVPYGPGGEAYVHYGSLIGELYKRAVYASRPEGDEDAVAVIRIVVTRTGSVRDAEWVRKTGISVLDRAVDRAMKTVRTVPAFPEGSTDSERTFTLNIGFEAKRIST